MVTEMVAHFRIMIFKPGGLILVGGREKVLASNTEGEGMEETNQGQRAHRANCDLKAFSFRFITILQFFF